MRERTVLADGFSKAYAMTGWRVGYLCAPAHLLEAIVKVHQYAIMCASTMSQAAALDALLHGEDDVAAMVASYDERRTVDGERPQRDWAGLLHATRRVLRLPIHRAHGDDLGGFRREAALRGEGGRGAGQRIWRGGAGFVRCTYCTAQDKISDALERMGRFVKKYS